MISTTVALGVSRILIVGFKANSSHHVVQFHHTVPILRGERQLKNRQYRSCPVDVIIWVDDKIDDNLDIIWLDIKIYVFIKLDDNMLLNSFRYQLSRW